MKSLACTPGASGGDSEVAARDPWNMEWTPGEAAVVGSFLGRMQGSAREQFEAHIRERIWSAASPYNVRRSCIILRRYLTNGQFRHRAFASVTLTRGLKERVPRVLEMRFQSVVGGSWFLAAVLRETFSALVAARLHLFPVFIHSERGERETIQKLISASGGEPTTDLRPVMACFMDFVTMMKRGNLPDEERITTPRLFEPGVRNVTLIRASPTRL